MSDLQRQAAHTSRTTGIQSFHEDPSIPSQWPASSGHESSKTSTADYQNGAIVKFKFWAISHKGLDLFDYKESLRVTISMKCDFLFDKGVPCLMMEGFVVVQRLTSHFGHVKDENIRTVFPGLYLDGDLPIPFPR